MDTHLWIKTSFDPSQNEQPVHACCCVANLTKRFPAHMYTFARWWLSSIQLCWSCIFLLMTTARLYVQDGASKAGTVAVNVNEISLLTARCGEQA